MKCGRCPQRTFNIRRNAMRFYNWAKNFEEMPTCDDVLKGVRKTERTYWLYAVICVLVVLYGISTMAEAAEDDIKEIAMGLFIAIAGFIYIAIIKLWVNIKLTMYFIIWDRNNTLEAEIKKSELQDM